MSGFRSTICCRANSKTGSRISAVSSSIRHWEWLAFSTSRPTWEFKSTTRISGRLWAGGAWAAALTWFCRSWVLRRSATASVSYSIPRPISSSTSTGFECTTRSTQCTRSAIAPTCSMLRAWSRRRLSTSTRSCATTGCSAAATSSTTAIRRGSRKSRTTNPPRNNQRSLTMNILRFSLLALLVPVAQAQEPAPDVLVKSITEEVVAVLKQDKDIQAGNPKKIEELIEAKVLPHFNFTRMTRIAMARNWRLAKPEDVEVTVRSEVKQSGSSQPVAIDYEMEKTPNGWKVYDVKVGGVSLVTTYRDTFTSEVKEHGVDGLIKSLAAKNRQSERAKSSKT